MSAFGKQPNPQLNSHGELQHLLTIEGLPREMLLRILDTAEQFVSVSEREVKKHRTSKRKPGGKPGDGWWNALIHG